MLKIRQFLWLISYSFYPASKLFSFSIISNLEQKVKLFWKTKEYVEEYLLFFRSNISKNSYHGIWFLSYSELGDRNVQVSKG